MCLLGYFVCYVVYADKAELVTKSRLQVRLAP